MKGPGVEVAPVFILCCSATVTTAGEGSCARSRTSMSASTGRAPSLLTAPTPWAASTAPAGRDIRGMALTAAPIRRLTKRRRRRRRRMTASTAWSRPTSTLGVAASVSTMVWSTMSWRRSGLGDPAVTVTAGMERSPVRTTPAVSALPPHQPAPQGILWTASRTPGSTPSSSQ